MQENFLLKRGTLGGVCTVILANITSGELVKTALLAAVGSVVSVLVSILLKRIIKQAPSSDTQKDP